MPLMQNYLDGKANLLVMFWGLNHFGGLSVAFGLRPFQCDFR